MIDAALVGSTAVLREHCQIPGGTRRRQSSCPSQKCDRQTASLASTSYRGDERILPDLASRIHRQIGKTLHPPTIFALSQQRMGLSI